MQFKTVSFVFFTCVVMLCSSQQQASAQKIYLLVAGDTKSPGIIGMAGQVDIENIHQAFWSHIPEEQLVPYSEYSNYGDNSSWTGPSVLNATDMKDAILNAIARCPAGRSDTIVFYWSGHGQYDSRGHYLVMPNLKPLYRWEVIEAIQKKSPRLAVVISDSCNRALDSRELRKEAPCYAMEPPPTISPLFDSLFIQHKGLVDINASSKDEFAICTADTGGFFTCALTSLKEKYSSSGEPTGRGIDIEIKTPSGRTKIDELPLGYFWTHDKKRETWNDLVTYIDRTVRRHWRWNNQKIKVWSLPHRLTTHVNRHDSDIPSVLSLTRNDVILSINGETIHDEDDCRRAIRASGKIMEFTVRDSRDGTIWRMQTRLRSSSPRFGIYLDDAPGGGALVTHTRFGSPATSNSVLGKVSSGNRSDNDNQRRPPQRTTTKTLSLSRGDVILSVNGQQIQGRSDCIRAVNNSPRHMTFTVRDSRDGTIWRMQTDLKGGKFGIDLRDARGGGAYVTSVRSGYPATQNQVLERVR